jgi:hypothetical protein
MGHRSRDGSPSSDATRPRGRPARRLRGLSGGGRGGRGVHLKLEQITVRIRARNRPAHIMICPRVGRVRRDEQWRFGLLRSSSAGMADIPMERSRWMMRPAQGMKRQHRGRMLRSEPEPKPSESWVAKRAVVAGGEGLTNSNGPARLFFNVF